MATTTMHFGPEWMRAKPQTPAARPQAPPSPPPPAISNTQQTNASTYSALVTPVAAPEPEKRDECRPFRYSKEAMLRIYKEGGGRGGLGLEVERWEGIVHEVSSEPTGLREMSDAEKKVRQIGLIVYVFGLIGSHEACSCLLGHLIPNFGGASLPTL
jgi:PERQ amino acid-rich with GYF domain-containing protein